MTTDMPTDTAAPQERYARELCKIDARFHAQLITAAGMPLITGGVIAIRCGTAGPSAAVAVVVYAALVVVGGLYIASRTGPRMVALGRPSACALCRDSIRASAVAIHRRDTHLHQSCFIEQTERKMDARHGASQ